MTHSYT